MSLLKASMEQSAPHPSTERDLEVDGTSVSEPRNTSTSAGETRNVGMPLIEPRYAVIPVSELNNDEIDRSTSQRDQTSLSIGNVTNYQNMIAYTRHRLDKVSSAPQKLTHTIRRPHIVIPCHTNIECTHCQLYDEPAESDTDDTELEETQESESLISGEEATRTSSTLEDSENERKQNDSHSPELTKERSSKLPAVDSSQQQKPSPQNPSHLMEHYYSRMFYPKFNRLTTMHHKVHEKKTTPNILPVESESDRILPKIYKLRYTKSSLPTSRSHYAMFETTTK